MKRTILTFVTLTAGLSLSQGAAIHNGLLSYWNFEGNYNDSAGSLSGNASTVADNGTAGAAVALTGAGPLGTYGDFGRTGLGTANVVAVPDSADLIAAGESLSISAWFRVDGFNQNWQALVAHGEGSDWRIARRAGEPTLGYAGGTGDIPGAAIGPDIVTGGGWHHVVSITEAGVNTRLWIDGSLIGTSAGVANLSNNGSGQMFIGGNPQGDAGSATVTQYRPWNGGIDDVALWNRPLSDSEISLIYQGGLAGASLAQIPEPAVSTLLGLIGFGLILRRRR